MPVAGAFNPQNYQLPPFIKQLGSGNEERSVLILDARDQRIQSPYQGWLLDEILLNAQSGINILSDRQLVRSPATGYHMNLFLRQGDRRVQADRGWIHDFLWIGALRQVGLLDGVCALAPGVPAISGGPSCETIRQLGWTSR